MHPQTIIDAINTLPRIPLAHKNTLLEEMPRLRAAIAESMDADIDAVPPLFIKRDDTTGFAFGGNKARHMEFLFAHLIERGIDTIVNINHYDSNNARLAAAASAKTGMKYHWVAFDELDAPITGNMLIAHLTGANIHRIPQDATRPYAETLLTQETNLGRNPTILLDNPFSQIAGMIAYLETAHEIDTQITNYATTDRRGNPRGRPGEVGPGNAPFAQRSEAKGARAQRAGYAAEVEQPKQPPSQLENNDCKATTNPLSRSAGEGQGEGDRGGQTGGARQQQPRKTTTATLSPNSPIHFWGLCGRSIAGIKLYARNTGKPWTATAVAQPHYTPENYQEIYLDRSTRVANLLNLDTPLKPNDITTLTGYTITYGIPTQAGIEAMHLVAATESIILDPTYTAKSMSALIAEIHQDNLDPSTPVIFIHSGGQPQTFAFPNQIWNH